MPDNPLVFDTVAAARDHLRKLGRTGAGSIKAPAGSGKTTRVMEGVFGRLQEEAATNEPAAAIFAAITHEQRDELAATANRLGIPYIVIAGRNAENCTEHERVARIGELGYSPVRSACLHCDHFRGKGGRCTYWQPFFDIRSKGGPFLVLCCHESVPGLLAMFEHQNRGMLKTLVFDESPQRALLQDRVIQLSAWNYPTHPDPGLLRSRLPVLGQDESDADFQRYRSALPRIEQGRQILWRIFDGVFNKVRLAWLLDQKNRVTLRTRTLMERITAAAAQLGTNWKEFISGSFADVLEFALLYLTKQMCRDDALYNTQLMPARLPALLRALAADLERYESGLDDWNSSVRVAPYRQIEPALLFTERVELPFLPPRLLILDATADIERERLLLNDATLPLHDIRIETQWRRRVHVRTNASRNRLNGKERDRVIKHLVETVGGLVVDHGFDQNSKLLVVTHGSKQNGFLKALLGGELKGAFPGTIATAHFAALRGLNEYRDFDIVVTVGDNEPNVAVLRDRIAALHRDDAEPLRTAMIRNEDVSRTLQDPRLERWRLLSVSDEIAQTAYRCRPLDRPGHCVFLHVGSRWPVEHVGAADQVIDPRTDIERAHILDRLRTVVAEHGFYATFIGESAGWYRRDGERRRYEPEMKAIGPILLLALNVAVSEHMKPFGVNTFRKHRDAVLDRLPTHMFDPACSRISGGSFKVWGDIGRFRKVWDEAVASSRATPPISGVVENRTVSISTRIDAVVAGAFAHQPVPAELLRAMAGNAVDEFYSRFIELFTVFTAPSVAQTTDRIGAQPSKSLLLGSAPFVPVSQLPRVPLIPGSAGAIARTGGPIDVFDTRRFDALDPNEQKNRHGLLIQANQVWQHLRRQVSFDAEIRLVNWLMPLGHWLAVPAPIVVAIFATPINAAPMQRSA